MTDRRHPVAAFVLAPSIVAAAIALLVFFATAAGHPGGLQAAFHMALVAFVAATGVGLALALVLGVPAYLAMKHLGIVSPWATAAVAALIGASLPWLAHFLLLDPSVGLSANGCRTVLDGVTTPCGYRQLALGMIAPALAGAAGGLVFWLVYNGGWRIDGRPKGRF